jgi:hypothetical protein
VEHRRGADGCRCATCTAGGCAPAWAQCGHASPPASPTRAWPPGAGPVMAMLLHEDMARHWASQAALQRDSLRWTWFRPAFQSVLDARQPPALPQPDEDALASAFLAWAQATEACETYAEVDALDHLHFMAGMLLQHLLAARPPVFTEPPVASGASAHWPSGAGTRSLRADPAAGLAPACRGSWPADRRAGCTRLAQPARERRRGRRKRHRLARPALRPATRVGGAHAHREPAGDVAGAGGGGLITLPSSA